VGTAQLVAVRSDAAMEMPLAKILLIAEKTAKPFNLYTRWSRAATDP
jgi:hypothetical protein